jgi:hypothetical protein
VCPILSLYFLPVSPVHYLSEINKGMETGKGTRREGEEEKGGKKETKKDNINIKIRYF